MALFDKPKEQRPVRKHHRRNLKIKGAFNKITKIMFDGIGRSMISKHVPPIPAL